ncbi:hypothetical protein B0H14DRAFT_3447680, partial [Mycena olivaceomarginata]
RRGRRRRTDSDDDYAPRKRERASPKKAIALPTPPPSSTSAPAPTSTAPPSTPVPGLDVVRQAKERLAKRLAELVSASTSDAQLPTPNPMSDATYAHPQQPIHQTQAAAGREAASWASGNSAEG